MQYHYIIKGADIRTEEALAEHDKVVWEELRKHGTHKVNSEFWKIKGPISRKDRMERVLEFWGAGDIVPRNPFLHSSLWGRNAKRDASRGENDSLAGYSESGEDGKILTDIRDESPEPDDNPRPRCRYGGGWR